MALLDTSRTIQAVSGTNGYTFYYYAQINSQDVINNKSNITFKWFANGINGYSYNGFTGLGVTLYWSTDNTNWTDLGYTTVSSISSSKTEKASKTFDVTHNADGTRSIYLRAVYNGGSTSYVPKADTYTSGALALTTIARASTLTIASSVIINNTTGNLPVTINRQNTSFYSRLYYSLSNGQSGWTNLGNSASTYYTFASLLDIIPQSNVSMTVTLVTYSDTSYANEVGRDSKTLSVTIDTSAIKPSIAINENIVVDTTNISGYAFAGFGKVRAKFTTTKPRGASSVTTKYTISYGSLATTSSTSTSQVSVISNVMPNSATNKTGITITATATDSRGAVASVTTNAITIYGYKPPSISGNFFRSNNQGSADEQGVYAYGNWSASVGTSTGSNAIQTLTSTFNSNRPNTVVSLAQTTSATYTVTATDKVGGTTTQSFTVSSAVYPMQLLDNGGGKVGVGFGVPASEYHFESALPIHEMMGHYVHYTIGQNGQGGLAKICTIHTDSAYINTPIEFTIHARTTMPFHVVVRFQNSSDSDPGLSVFQGDTDHEVYLAKTATARWALFVRKSEPYDYIVVDDVKWRHDYRNMITWEYDGKSWTDAELQTMTGLTGLSRINKKINIDGNAATAGALTVSPSIKDYWKTTPGVNYYHFEGDSTSTFDIPVSACDMLVASTGERGFAIAVDWTTYARSQTWINSLHKDQKADWNGWIKTPDKICDVLYDGSYDLNSTTQVAVNEMGSYSMLQFEWQLNAPYVRVAHIATSLGSMPPGAWSQYYFFDDGEANMVIQFYRSTTDSNKITFRGNSASTPGARLLKIYGVLK